MRYYPRLKLFKATNNTYDETKAVSYGWYVYGLKLSNGEIVITTHGYSPTTRRHISDFTNLVGYDAVKHRVLAPLGLDRLDVAVNAIKSEIKNLKTELKNKRNRNVAEREQKIAEFEQQLKIVKMIKADQKKAAKKNNQFTF